MAPKSKKTTPAAKKAPAPKKAPAKGKATATAAKKAPSASPKQRLAPKKPVVGVNAVGINGVVRPANFYARLPCAAVPSGPGSRIPTAAPSGLFGKIGAFFLGSGRNASQKGCGTARDFAFPTEQGIQFFTTSAAALFKSPFRVNHNYRLRYTAGELAETYCSVVGLRGGMIWVVNDAENPALATSPAEFPDFLTAALATPGGAALYANGFAFPLVAARSFRDLEAEYGLVVAMTSGGNLKSMLETSPQIFEKYPSGLLNFLQYAPDLAVEVADANGKPFTTFAPPTLGQDGCVKWAHVNEHDRFAYVSGNAAAFAEARVGICIVPAVDWDHKGDDAPVPDATVASAGESDDEDAAKPAANGKQAAKKGGGKKKAAKSADNDSEESDSDDASAASSDPTDNDESDDADEEVDGEDVQSSGVPSANGDGETD